MDGELLAFCIFIGIMMLLLYWALVRAARHVHDLQLEIEELERRPQ